MKILCWCGKVCYGRWKRFWKISRNLSINGADEQPLVYVCLLFLFSSKFCNSCFNRKLVISSIMCDRGVISLSNKSLWVFLQTVSFWLSSSVVCFCVWRFSSVILDLFLESFSGNLFSQINRSVTGRLVDMLLQALCMYKITMELPIPSKENQVNCLIWIRFRDFKIGFE